MTNDIPLILLSGMSTDDRLFRFQKEAFPGLVVPAWIEPEANESLAHYAERLAQLVDPGVPCFIGGASFGGMVALEMTRHLNVMACFLIASVRCPTELPWTVRACRPLGWIGPRCANRLLEVAPRVLKPSLSKRAELRIRRYARSNASFVRWASLAVVGWRASGDWNCPVYQIHGQLDRTLPVALTTPDEIVPAGDHLLPFTSPQEVNEFLASKMRLHASVAAS